jgi:putative transposase
MVPFALWAISSSWPSTWRNQRAAQKFFRKLLKGLQYLAPTIITDKLRSYAAAKVEVMPSVEQQQQRQVE